MIMKRLYIFVIINIIFLTLSSGQEFHFTQYERAPTLVNPAFVGQFSGTYRVNGVYRDQYRGSAKNAFESFSITADLPVITGFRKQDWIGAGLMLSNDKAAVAEQQMSLFGLNVSYHLGLDKKQTRILSVGVQYSSGGYSYNRANATFSSGLLNGAFSALAQAFVDSADEEGIIPGGNLGDLQVGLMYNLRGKTTDFKIGAAVDGLLSPNRGVDFTQDSINHIADDTKSLGINVIGVYEHELNKKTSLMHTLYYSTQDGASFINYNSRVKYQLKPESDIRLVAGLGTRSLRAVLFYVGVEKGPWNVGLGYDIDIGKSLDATGGHKSIELGVTYLGIINKKPEPKPIIYCPRI